ncbi:MAG: hypothetical protein JNL19_00390 [Burkholderiales bacterium]|nr:hypothetical protein [Burkholderiales bacterium]
MKCTLFSSPQTYRVIRVWLALATSLDVGAAFAQSNPAPAQTTVPPLSAEQFAKVCSNTHDPADCGKKIEAIQLPKLRDIVKRDGSLLAVTVPGEPPFLFEDKPGEAGPNVSLYAYHAAADAVVLYRAQADRIDFLLVHRGTVSSTELPNEPLFNSDGRYFATADFCKDGCENRLAIWRFERRGPARERVFAPRTPWSDAGVSWGAPRRLIVDFTDNGKNASINLELSDPRWTVLLP